MSFPSEIIYKRRSKLYRTYLKETAERFNSNGKKTVLMTCDTYFPVMDGVVNVLDNYAKRLAATMNVIVLAPAFKGTVSTREYPVLGVKSAYSYKLKYPVALPAFDFRAKRFLKKLRIDLIHCHSPFFVGRLALKLHKKRDIPMVCTFHSQYKQDFARYVGDGKLADFLLRFIMKTFNGADEVWTMNPAVTEVIRSYGYKGKTRLIPHGTVMPLHPDPAEDRRRAREKFGIGENELLFLFVGRLITQKNILFLAETLGELKRRGLAFRMLFAGDGPDKPKLIKKLRAENVWEETIFAGHISNLEELGDIYAAADLMLFPSEYDTFGLVKVEAASRKTPTAFAEGSVASSDVTHGVNGYIFPCEKSAFADGILRAVRDPATLRAVGEGAMRDLYVTWDGITELVRSCYFELFRS